MKINFHRDVLKLLDSQKTCVVGSVDEQGVPNMMAMSRPRKIIDLKTLYFSTNTSSVHVRQYRANPNAAVYFHKRFPGFKGVLLKGVMDILMDSDVKKTLWKKGDEKHYPAGAGDADYCVLRFTVIEGRFYQKKESRDFKAEEFDSGRGR